MKKIILGAAILTPLSLFAMDKSEMVDYTAKKFDVAKTEININSATIQSNFMSSQWTADIKGERYYCSSTWFTDGCVEAPSFAKS